MSSLFHLSDEQRDMFTEAINIGFGRAAASLSILVGQKVILEVPRLSILPISELAPVITKAYQNLAAVEQRFAGGLTGDVILIMDLEIAARFIDLLSGGEGLPRALTTSDREALLEVGNILLNAYIGSFGNFLHTQINFSVPTLHLQTLNKALSSIESTGFEQAVLLVETKFLLHNGTVAGHVALIVETNSLSDLFQYIQTSGLNE